MGTIGAQPAFESVPFEAGARAGPAVAAHVAAGPVVGVVEGRIRVPGRVLQELEVGEKEPLPYPAQSWLTAPIKRAASEVGDVERMSLYAGQGVSLIKHGRAEDLMAELVRGLTG